MDLNTENPLVNQYLIDSYNQYIDMGVDAFRVDTVKHVSRYIFNKYFVPAWKTRGAQTSLSLGKWLLGTEMCGTVEFRRYQHHFILGKAQNPIQVTVKMTTLPISYRWNKSGQITLLQQDNLPRTMLFNRKYLSYA